MNLDSTNPPMVVANLPQPNHKSFSWVIFYDAAQS